VPRKGRPGSVGAVDLIALLAALAASDSPAQAPASRQDAAVRENVVVIVADDLGPELIGFYDRLNRSKGIPSGSPASTPVIDSMLAGRGVTFANAWACPNCSPTRAALLTGRQPSRNGVGTVVAAVKGPLNPGLQSSMPLLPQALAAAPAPRTSAAIGKWHLGSSQQIAIDPRHPLGSPPGAWFDHFAGTYFNASTPPGVPSASLGYSAWTKGFATVLDLTIDPCEPAGTPCKLQMIAPPLANYATIDTTEDALELIGKLPEPYFLYVAYNAIHKPWHDVPAGSRNEGEEGSSPAPPEDAARSAIQRRARGMLEVLDAQLGRLLSAIDENDTHVIFLGDNGSARPVAARPFRPEHAKGTIYEGGIHVPLIVRSPRIAAEDRGKVTKALAHCTDVFATVCELADAPLPRPELLDGVSLLPALADPDSAGPRTLLYTESFFPNFAPDPATGAPPPDYRCRRHDQAVRDARFKLIRMGRRDAEGAPAFHEKLFDLVTPVPGPGGGMPDFVERFDLLSSPDPLPDDVAAALKSLRAELDLRRPSLIR
jgi:arylsulfatase A-like enzyme